MDSAQTTRWVGVVASTWVETTAGNGYTYAFYAPTLKEVLSYSQAQLNTLGFAKDLGDNVGILAGLASDRLPVWGILAIGAIQSFVGYGVVWLVVSERIQALPLWQLCALLAVGANSSTWLDTACLVTCIRNFPHQRGTIAGILKCFYGLSSAIFTLLYNAIFQNDPASFLLLVAVGPSVVSLLAVYFIRPVGPSTQKEGVKEQSSFTIMQVCTTIFIVFLFVATLYIGLGNPNPPANKILAGVLILFFTVPLCIPLVSPRHSNGHTQKNVSSIDEEEDQRPLLVQIESDSSDFDSTRNSIDEIQHYTSKEVVHDNPTASQVEDVRVSDVKPFERNVTFTEALLTTDFWLLFFAFLCGMGSAITAINNLGQLGEAQGYTNASIFVSLISISNSIGRLGGGAVGDYYVRYACTPRPLWMAWAQAVMIVAHLLFATAIPGSLYLSSILLGVTFGVHASVIIPTASELFGLKSLGMLYNTLFIASPLGSLLFSGVIAGFLYDRESRVAAAEHHCTGAHCFRLTFVIMAGVCLVGIVLNILLVARTRSLYQSLYGTRQTQPQGGHPLLTSDNRG